MLKVVCAGVCAAAVAAAAYIEHEQPRRDGRLPLSSSGTLLPQSESRLQGYPKTYYRDILREEVRRREGLRENVEVDVCVVGGGLAGLATALGLAERGKSVAIVESRRVGWNASGRNGGFAIPGLSVDAADLISMLGPKDARDIYQLTLSAAALLKARIARYSIDCDMQPHGTLTVSTFPSRAAKAEADVALCNEVLGTHFEFWTAEQFRRLYPSPLYHHAVLDKDAFIVQPLALCAGLARACESLGVTIYEDSPAQRLEEEGERHKVVVRSIGGGERNVTCNAVVLAGSCQLSPEISWMVSRSVVPYYTYIGVTEPLDEKPFSPDAVYTVVDDITCLNYFRRLPDGRLLWGGRISPANYTEGWSDDVAKEIKALVAKHFPSLGQDFKIEYTWGGDIAFGPSKLPHIGRRGEGVYYATGFGGHGVVPTTMAGEMIAHAIATEDNSHIDRYQAVCPTLYAGWPFDRLGARIYIMFKVFCDHFRS